MRSRVEAGGFEVGVHVGDGGRRVLRERHRAVRDEPIDVVHPEANAFEMERTDRAIQRGYLVEQSRRIVVRRQRADDRREVGQPFLSGLTMVGGVGSNYFCVVCVVCGCCLWLLSVAVFLWH